MHVEIVALLIKLIDWQYYAFQNTVDSRYCEHPRGVGGGGRFRVGNSESP